jgi:hypothetical protein
MIIASFKRGELEVFIYPRDRSEIIFSYRIA